MIFSFVVLLLTLAYGECQDLGSDDQEEEALQPELPPCTFEELLRNRDECAAQAEAEKSKCVKISFDIKHCGCYYEMHLDCLVAEKKQQMGERLCAARASKQVCGTLHGYDVESDECDIRVDKVCVLQNKALELLDNGVALFNRYRTG